MPALGKKLGIFAATIFETISLTGIAPFFPSIAAEQGIPTWVIGMIFSTSPFVSLICSPFIPALMERFGRKFVLVMGLVWISIGNALLLFIIFTPPYGAILLSFTGRIFIGFGYSWSLISIYTTLTSDFPEEAAKMIALIEIISGVGLTIGPSFGSFMYGMTNYLFTCLTFAGLNLIMVPTLYVILGKMRDYKILREEPISFVEILGKPKIAMDFVMQVMVMVAFGFLLPTTEFHLESFSISSDEAGYFFSICTFSYLLSSLIVSFLPKNWNKPRILLFGCMFMAFGFLFIGPNEYLFPKKLEFVIIGLIAIGFAGGFMYVLTMPHMLDVAVADYSYPKDDRLHDTISGLTSASLCIGEVIGPTISSVLYSVIGYSSASDIFCIIIVVWGLFYAVFSEAFRKTKKENLIGKELVTEGGD